MTSLSQKSLNNSLTRSNSQEIVGFDRPDYTAIVSRTLGTTYTEENNGWIYANAYTANGTFTLKIDNETSAYWHTDSGQSEMVGFLIPVKKGSSWNCTKSGTGSCTLKFIPCLGG